MNDKIQRMINRANYINSKEIPDTLFNQIIDKVFEMSGAYDKLERQIIIQVSEHKNRVLIFVDYKIIIDNIRTELIEYEYMASESEIVNAIIRFCKSLDIIYKEESYNGTIKIGLIVYLNKEVKEYE